MKSKVPAIIIMGVAGCGKTTVGKALAEKIGCRYFEGDRFHPPENIEKMSKGVPLTDEDRRPWLLSIRAAVKNARESVEDARGSGNSGGRRQALLSGAAAQ